MSTNLKIVIAAVACALLVFVVLIPNFTRARTGSGGIACGAYLRQIDDAKAQWALENHKTVNDTPSWKEVGDYLKAIPKCPHGGTYILGRWGEPVRCTVNGTYTNYHQSYP